MTLVRDTLVQNSLVSKYLETIRAVDGEVLNLSFHQLRLEKALDANTTHRLDSLLNPPQNGLYRCRVVYDAKSIEVSYIKYVKRSIKKLKLVYDDTIEYAKKYENREDIEKLVVQKESCDDVLIVKNGLLCDTSIANIALYDGSVWFTPNTPLLEGTTRARLLQNAALVVKDIKPEELKNYSKIALMNAMIDFDIIAVENIEEMIC